MQFHLSRYVFAVVLLAICRVGTHAGEPDRDPYHHLLPKGAKARLGMWRDHSNSLTRTPSVASPDSQLVAASIGKRVLIWDQQTGKLVQDLRPHAEEVHALVFADNDTLVTQGRAAGLDSVKRWHVRTGKLQRSFDVPGAWSGAVFSHDGKLLAFASKGPGRTVHVWDADAGKELFAAREDRTGLRFSPDGRWLISSRIDNPLSIITFRAARTGKVVRKLELKDRAVLVSAGSPDGKYLLGHTHIILDHPNNWRGRWQLFDAETGAVVRTFIEQPWLNPLGFVLSPDGSLVAGVDVSEGNLSVWEAKSGKRLQTFPYDRYAMHLLSFTPNGRTLIYTTSTGLVSLNDLKTHTTRNLNPTHNSKVESLAFSADGKQLASGSEYSELFLWEVAARSLKQRCLLTRTEKKYPPNWPWAAKLAFAPDGKHLLVQQADRRVRLYAPWQGQEVNAFREAGPIYGFSDDGTHLLWSSLPLNVMRGRYLDPKSIKADDPQVVCAALRWMMYAFWRPQIGQFHTLAYFAPRLTDLGPEVAAPAMMVFERNGSAAPVGLSPDGSVLVETMLHLTGIPTSSMGLQLTPAGTRLTDTATGREILRTKAGYHDPRLGGIIRGGVPAKPPEIVELQVLQLGPDSRSMACSVRSTKANTSGLKLYEVRTGKERLHLSKDAAAPAALAFSHNGRWLAWITPSQAIELFDLTLGKRAATLTPEDSTTALAFSPDGALLASGSSQGIILLWDMNTLAKNTAQENAWTDEEKTRLWTELADADAVKAYTAMRQLKRSPHQAVPLIRARLNGLDAKDQAGRWLEQLGSADYAVRQKAGAGLHQLGEFARPLLVYALTQPASLERKRHLELLLNQLGPPFTSAAGRRQLRAIEVLDSLRTTDAAVLLRELGKASAPDMPLGLEIARALRRLAS